VEAQQNTQMEMDLMELRMKGLRSELSMKEDMLTQKDLAKVQMNEKIKGMNHFT
jgi:hypothetical protein